MDRLYSERDLVRAILGRGGKSDSEIDIHLGAAAALNVDMLDYCARRLGLGETLVLERAARWAGLSFAEQPPHLAENTVWLPKLEALATLRALKTRVMGREMVFAAPSFAEVIRLRDIVSRQPDFPRFFCITSARAVRGALTEAENGALLGAARDRNGAVWGKATTARAMGLAPRLGMFAALIGTIGFVIFASLSSSALLQNLLGILLVVSTLPKFFATLSAAEPVPRPDRIDDGALPVYTVLLPLHREANMVPQLAAAMRALDYPPEKLDIKFVVEASSPDTIAAVRGELADPRFELVVVPDARPMTKPKAMNFALPLVRGEFVVVFDAEDVPDPQQLRLAVARFRAESALSVLQAELVPENADETLLTRLFAAEYAGHFGVMLPYLVKTGMPLALGGTSNHFRTAVLRAVGGWDSNNVTEDADMGLKLARKGLHIGMLHSATREEAPLRPMEWMRQRARWSKGWMQTCLAHGRDLPALYRDLGPVRFGFFWLNAFGILFASSIHSAFIATIAVGAVFGSGLETPSFAFLTLAAFFGYGTAAALTLRGLTRSGRGDLILAQSWLIGYWVLHAAATLRGATELMLRPNYWAKTSHGETHVVRQVRSQPQRAYRDRARSEVSISAGRPDNKSARTRPDPAAMVHPNVP